jgi:hypothetical protein
MERTPSIGADMISSARRTSIETEALLQPAEDFAYMLEARPGRLYQYWQCRRRRQLPRPQPALRLQRRCIAYWRKSLRATGREKVATSFD